jgi:hypothetical protein
MGCPYRRRSRSPEDGDELDLGVRRGTRKRDATDGALVFVYTMFKLYLS